MSVTQFWLYSFGGMSLFYYLLFIIYYYKLAIETSLKMVRMMTKKKVVLTTIDRKLLDIYFASYVVLNI